MSDDGGVDLEIVWKRANNIGSKMEGKKDRTLCCWLEQLKNNVTAEVMLEEAWMEGLVVPESKIQVAVWSRQVKKGPTQGE